MTSTLNPPQPAKSMDELRQLEYVSQGYGVDNVTQTNHGASFKVYYSIGEEDHTFQFATLKKTTNQFVASFRHSYNEEELKNSPRIRLREEDFALDISSILKDRNIKKMEQDRVHPGILRLTFHF